MQVNLKEALGLKHPLIVAPLAGGPTTPDLVAASCNAGALGSLGGAYSSPEAILKDALAVRSMCKGKFAINLFAPAPIPPLDPERLKQAIEATAGYRRELQLPTPKLEPPYEENFDRQLEAVIEARPAVLSYVFGTLAPHYMRRVKNEGILLIGGATTLEEARIIEDSGADAVVLQGFEAGGHRALLSATAIDQEIELFDLLKRCRGKLKIPMIAAGGLMNKIDIERALNAGAQMVQLGTAFLNVKEAGTNKAYRDALRGSRVTKTTRAFSGRLARGIKNRFMIEIENRPESILPFPLQNKFTRDLRKKSGELNNPDFLSLWAGTGAGEPFNGTAAELISVLFK